MDSMTADGQADNERFFYLITACVHDYETQKPVYTSLDDYHEKSDTDLAIECATQFANFAYGLEENYEDKLIENKLLKKLGLLNKKGQLTNKHGQRVDLEGNLLNEEGARVDKDGNRIDINNNPVIDDSIIDTLEFEDDLGENEVEEKSTTKKSRSSSAKKKEADEELQIRVAAGIVVIGTFCQDGEGAGKQYYDKERQTIYHHGFSALKQVFL